MSSTKRGAERQAHDAYYTPDAVARACVEVLGLCADDTVFEPSVGAGAFARAVRFGYPLAYINGCDIDPTAPALNGFNFFYANFLNYNPRTRVDWVVGNPPFDQAEAHIRHARKVSFNTAFLLRLAMLESDTRKPLWEEHPPSEVHILRQRVPFLERYEDGTIGPLRKRKDGELVLGRDGRPKLAGVDSAAYAFFVWRSGHKGPSLMYWIDWK
jgi:hypothetical protein